MVSSRFRRLRQFMTGSQNATSTARPTPRSTPDHASGASQAPEALSARDSQAAEDHERHPSASPGQITTRGGRSRLARQPGSRTRRNAARKPDDDSPKRKRELDDDDEEDETSQPRSKSARTAHSDLSADETDALADETDAYDTVTPDQLEAFPESNLPPTSSPPRSRSRTRSSNEEWALPHRRSLSPIPQESLDRAAAMNRASIIRDQLREQQPPEHWDK